MLEKGKAHILLLYYRRLDSTRDNGYHTDISHQKNNYERGYSAQTDLREGRGQSNTKCELSSASSVENWQEKGSVSNKTARKSTTTGNPREAAPEGGRRKLVLGIRERTRGDAKGLGIRR